MALPVEVIRSPRRRKTVQATVVDGVVQVRVPSWMSRAEVDEHVAELVPRLERRLRSDHVDLMGRALRLARRFDLPEPRSVTWADNHRRQWGSCQVASGDIRLSRRLADYPSWVLDYVLVHELAHLVHADHSSAFRALVDRYPRAERARGFLIAKDLELPQERAGDQTALATDEDDGPR
jgi:predicted metal-dependent hydrolase